MKNIPIWVKDAMLILFFAYLMFTFVTGTMDPHEWTYGERAFMMVCVAITNIFTFLFKKMPI